MNEQVWVYVLRWFPYSRLWDLLQLGSAMDVSLVYVVLPTNSTPLGKETPRTLAQVAPIWAVLPVLNRFIVSKVWYS